MFRTDPILFLQQFASEPLTRLMIVLTSLGSQGVFVLCCVVLIFGLDFRRGVLVMQALLLAALVTVAAKHTFELPRPWGVDSRIQRLHGDIPNTTPFIQSSTGWFELPAPEAIAHVRGLEEVDWGFPSGHTSTALAMWGAIALLWRDRRVRVVCALLVFAIPLTRLYLGQHFVADLLGGYTIGLAVLFGVRGVVRAGRPVDRLAGWLRGSWSRVLALATGALALTLSPILLHARAEPLTLVAGVELGLIAVLARGIPELQAGPWRAVGRVALALALFVGVTVAGRALGLAELWVGPLAAFALIFGGSLVPRRLGL